MVEWLSKGEALAVSSQNGMHWGVGGWRAPQLSMGAVLDGTCELDMESLQYDFYLFFFFALINKE